MKIIFKRSGSLKNTSHESVEDSWRELQFTTLKKQLFVNSSDSEVTQLNNCSTTPLNQFFPPGGRMEVNSYECWKSTKSCAKLQEGVFTRVSVWLWSNNMNPLQLALTLHVVQFTRPHRACQHCFIPLLLKQTLDRLICSSDEKFCVSELTLILRHIVY